MASAVLVALNTLQVAFSAYNLYLASISIRKLSLYEESAKKAAGWSRTAADQLYTTRTTQASGTVAILCSFLGSIASIFYTKSKIPLLIVAGANIIILLLAREHVGRFWKRKAKIPLPGAGDFNDAISTTQTTRMNMAYLAVSWAITGALSLVL